MAAFEVPCPQCGMKLKVPDRSYLGKKAKCGGCEHRFIIEEQTVADEVDFQLAQPAGEGSSTMVGVFARYVADDAPATPHPSSVRAGKPVARPPVQPITPAPTAPVQGVLPAGDNGLGFDPGLGFPMGGPVASTGATTYRRKKRGSGLWVTMLVVLAIAGGAGYWALNQPAPVKGTGAGKEAGKGAGKTAKKAKSDKSKSAVADGSEKAGSEPDVAAGEFEQAAGGKPIDLILVPSGAYAVIHVRPAELWAKGGTAEEVQACLGPLGKWAATEIERVCFLPPAEIEEAVFAFIPTTKGQAPELCVVVRAKKELKRSALLDQFNGEQMDDLGRPYIKGDKLAYLILDGKTFAACPATLAAEMVEAADKPAIIQDSMQELLYKTDRAQHVTLVFMPAAVREDVPFLAPVATSLLNHLLDWFGDDVEGVAWSANLGEKFESRLLLRNAVVTTTKSLASAVAGKLKQTPHDLLEVVQKSHPRQLGRRKVIGRFPAMTQVFAKSTRLTMGPRLVALETTLPERAGPNLALASLLTWDAVQQPDYGVERAQPAEPSAAPSAAPAGTIPERLAKVISVDFRDEFLYSALDFIGEETGTKFKLEGNDLKLAGITQNERQTFKMDNQPGTAVLFSMLDKKGMCIVIDEKAKLVIVTTKVSAKEKGLTTFALEPPK
jgi:hypothetical protein